MMGAFFDHHAELGSASIVPQGLMPELGLEVGEMMGGISAGETEECIGRC